MASDVIRPVDIPAELPPETRAYRLKRLLLGKPLVSEQLAEERLASPVALGVLSPDCISSSAYGSEQMLTQLIPFIGVAAFALVVPITIAILVVLFTVTLSYREVVMVYTKAGGSYVVARDNFGPRVAQVAAVALLIDYTVTVAVQTAAATDALASAVPVLNHRTYITEITVLAVLLLVYGNLRGLREAGRLFAIPTYFFIVVMMVVIVLGLIRVALGDLPVINVHAAGAMHLGHDHSGFIEGASLFLVLKSFANGGSSLTGLEAISNGVSAFQPPEGVHARRTLVAMSSVLGTLLLGISLLAHFTHAIPYVTGAPTVISQIGKDVFGHSAAGTFGFYVVQLATGLILYTGANTSFNGFPFLASFVAEDGFLPRKLTKRGHRLAFSNGIVALAAVAILLLVLTRASVTALVAVYAIGVFVGFTMAGAGMVKHHLRTKEPGWRRRIVINGSAGVLSFAVVLILAVTKFTEGAYIVVILFPILLFILLRLNQRYREEAEVLGEAAAGASAEARPLPRHVAFVLVDRLDLATARAIQYARTLSPDDLRAVHFVVDTTRAGRLSDAWVRLGLSHLPLELIDCPDRRVIRACVEMAAAATDGRTEVTALLPRRSYNQAWNRFLHDSTGERMAAALSRMPHVNATIVPFDVEGELRTRRQMASRRAATVGAATVGAATDGAATYAAATDAAGTGAVGTGRTTSDSAGPGRVGPDDRPADDEFPAAAPTLPPPTWLGDAEKEEQEVDRQLLDGVPGTTPIGSLRLRQRAKVAGRVRSVTFQPWGGLPTLVCAITDDRGEQLDVTFLGRRRIPGMEPGARLVLEGTVGEHGGHLTMINPSYEFATPPPPRRR